MPSIRATGYGTIKAVFEILSINEKLLLMIFVYPKLNDTVPFLLHKDCNKTNIINQIIFECLKALRSTHGPLKLSKQRLFLFWSNSFSSAWQP